jgi:hypothetical protein
MVFVRTGAGLVCVFARATDWREAAVHETDKFANADLVCGLCERVTTKFSAMGLNDAGIPEFLKNALNEFEGKPVGFSEFGTGNGAPSNLGGNAKIDGGSQSVFSLFG